MIVIYHSTAEVLSRVTTSFFSVSNALASFSLSWPINQGSFARSNILNLKHLAPALLRVHIADNFFVHGALISRKFPGGDSGSEHLIELLQSATFHLRHEKEDKE
jgi:hypothetical protein